MENKLTLADIAGYLPYGLKVEYRNDGNIATIDNVYNISFGDDTVKLAQYFCDGEHLWMFKPFLRPMSMLYQTIVHDGKEEVPIVELAKIADPEEDWILLNESAIYRNVYGLYAFLYNEDDGFYISREDVHLPEYTTVNQVKIYDWLAERFFDFRNLIGRGLAIKIEE